MPSTWDSSFSSVPLIRRCSFILEPHSSCIFFSCVSFFHVLCLCTLTPSIVYLPLKPFDVSDLPLHFEPVLSSFQFDSPQCFCLFIESAFKFSIAFVISFSLIFVGFVGGGITQHIFFLLMFYVHRAVFVLSSLNSLKSMTVLLRSVPWASARWFLLENSKWLLWEETVLSIYILFSVCARGYFFCWLYVWCR